MTRPLHAIVLGSLALTPLLALVLTTAGQEPDERPTRAPTRAQFMRKKLEFAKNVLEGLTTEDYALVAKNAKGLRLLSQAAEWEVPTIPDVENYLAYTVEFQRITSDMAKKAEAKNLDGATLDYVRMTTNCVNCHKYVRTTKK
jgi:hypothetical protein